MASETLKKRVKKTGAVKLALLAGSFVDDEAALVEAGKAMLEKLGYDVNATTNAIEAIEEFHKDPQAFDLLITDYTMPDMTGLDLAKKLLRIRPDLPIILCTGFSQVLTEEDVNSSGIRKLVMKPVIFRELSKTIREVFEKKA